MSSWWHAAATRASHDCLRGLGRPSEVVPEERWPHSCEGVRPVSCIGSSGVAGRMPVNGMALADWPLSPPTCWPLTSCRVPSLCNGTQHQPEPRAADGSIGPPGEPTLGAGCRSPGASKEQRVTTGGPTAELPRGDGRPTASHVSINPGGRNTGKGVDERPSIRRSARGRSPPPPMPKPHAQAACAPAHHPRDEPLQASTPRCQPDAARKGTRSPTRLGFEPAPRHRVGRSKWRILVHGMHGITTSTTSTTSRSSRPLKGVGAGLHHCLRTWGRGAAPRRRSAAPSRSSALPADVCVLSSPSQAQAVRG